MEHDGCTFCPMFKAPMGFVTMRADSFMNGDGVRSTEYMCSPGSLGHLGVCGMANRASPALNAYKERWNISRPCK